MPVITTWEGMPVPIPDGVDRRAFADRVLSVTASAPFPCFRLKKGRLHAAEVVGCLQVGKHRINVLPKLDIEVGDRDKDFLLNILRVAGYLSRFHGGSASVRASARDPLEAVISEVASEMMLAMADGIPRRYEEKREDLTALRGRIDFVKLSTRLPSGHVALPVRHSPLSIDNQLARYLKWIALTLFRLTGSSTNRQSFAGILARFSSIESQIPSIAALESISLGRNELHWSKSIAMGHLLINGQFPDPTSTGLTDAFSMLFTLQHLFERAMRGVLKAALHDLGIQVRHRTEPLFLLQEPGSGEGILRLKPDYVFYRDGEVVSLADAKWKRINETGRAHGVKREDLYQIFAYLERYKSPTSIIFVPKAGWMSANWVAWYEIPDSGSRVYLLGVDIEKLVSHDKRARDGALSAFTSTLKEILLSDLTVY